MGRLIPEWDDLRSYVGMAALLVFVLPAVVLLLTLLADYGRPTLMQKSDSGGGRSEVAHRRVHPEADEQGASRERGVVRPRDRGGEDGSPEGGSEVNGAGPTRQAVREPGDAVQAQDPLDAATFTPATPTATAGASGSNEVLGSAPAPPTPTAEPTPVGASPPALAEAATASADPDPAPEISAPAIVGPMPTPSDVPPDGAQDTLTDGRLYDPPE